MAFKKKDRYVLNYRLIVPFIVELKHFFSTDPDWTFDEDEVKTQIIIQPQVFASPTTMRRKPIVSVSRSAIQRQRSVISNIGSNTDVYNVINSKPYGEVLNTNVEILIESSTPFECEVLSGEIFNHLEYNKHLFFKYGFTDVYFNYITKIQPTEGASNATVNTWQIGLNANVRIDENYLLKQVTDAIMAKEIKILDSMAEQQLTLIK